MTHKPVHMDGLILFLNGSAYIYEEGVEMYA